MAEKKTMFGFAPLSDEELAKASGGSPTPEDDGDDDWDIDEASIRKASAASGASPAVPLSPPPLTTRRPSVPPPSAGAPKGPGGPPAPSPAPPGPGPSGSKGGGTMMLGGADFARALEEAAAAAGVSTDDEGSGVGVKPDEDGAPAAVVEPTPETAAAEPPPPEPVLQASAPPPMTGRGTVMMGSSALEEAMAAVAAGPTQDPVAIQPAPEAAPVGPQGTVMLSSDAIEAAAVEAAGGSLPFPADGLSRTDEPVAAGSPAPFPVDVAPPEPAQTPTAPAGEVLSSEAVALAPDRISDAYAVVGGEPESFGGEVARPATGPQQGTMLLSSEAFARAQAEQAAAREATPPASEAPTGAGAPQPRPEIGYARPAQTGKAPGLPIPTDDARERNPMLLLMVVALVVLIGVIGFFLLMR